MKIEMDLNDMYPVIAEVLESGGEFTMVVAGYSMLPMIRHRRDSVTLAAICGRLKKHDIALYRRKNGQFVLHRVMKVLDEKDGYVFCGDSQTSYEYGIRDADLLAIVKAVIRDGKTIPVNSAFYKLYVFFWCILLEPVRGILIRVYRKLKRIFGIKKS